MTYSKSAFALFIVAVAWTPAQADEAAGLCATAEQAKQVRALYAAPPMPPPFMAAPKLGVPDATVLSALPGELAVGTSGAAFHLVWESLQAWQRPVTLVLKAGHVFEVFGRIPPGEPSKISKNFNLEDREAGLGGHLRPDLVSAIYAINLQGPEGAVRGVMFLDPAGQNAFSVFLPEALKPSADEIAQFEQTRSLIAGQPRACR